MDSNKESDDSLIELFQHGDLNKTKPLFLKYKKYLHTLCKIAQEQVTDGSLVLHDDLFSEATIMFTKSMYSYTPGTNTYKAYLRKIVLRRLNHYIQEELVHIHKAKFSLDEKVFSDNDVITYGDILTKEEALKDDKRNYILEFNEKSEYEITEFEQKVLVLRLSGLKIKEIAERLNIKPHQVKYVIKKAKDKAS